MTGHLFHCGENNTSENKGKENSGLTDLNLQSVNPMGGVFARSPRACCGAEEQLQQVRQAEPVLRF